MSNQAKPKLDETAVRQILAEYPDADLTAFDIGGLDVEEIAVEEVSKQIERVSAQFRG